MQIPSFFAEKSGRIALPAGVCSALAILCLVGLIAASGAAAQRSLPPNALGAGGHLWISATPIDNARQLLIVIDPGAKNAAIYHVDAAAGTLSLKSTRDISWDLLVGDFNAQEPKPAALRKMLEIGRDPAADGQNRP